MLAYGLARLFFIVETTRKSHVGRAVSPPSKKSVFCGLTPQTADYKNQHGTKKNLKVHGKVKNTGQKPYRFVTVIFTAYDNKGVFITRESTYIDPHDIAEGEVGYVNLRITCEGVKPARIEFQVLGK